MAYSCYSFPLFDPYIVWEFRRRSVAQAGELVLVQGVCHTADQIWDLAKIQYVLDELEGYAALRDTASGW